MPRLLVVMTAIFLAGVFSPVGQAQTGEAHLTIEELSCDFCHTCDSPTVKHPCLRVCPRKSAAAIAREMSQKRPPDVVYLDELEELYLPVPFDHQGHADMSDMMDGCATCHHYTPEGAAQPACKSCHEAAPKRVDIRKPGLKAAYHRQCMSCHREWSGGTQCAACHPPKIGEDQKAPSPQELLGKMHPPIPEPHTKIYEPESKPLPGAKVIFRHKEHIDRFGLRCAECHREESCSRCHQERSTDEEQEVVLGDRHGPCSACHDVENKDACDHCHWKEGEAKPKPFDHADTGWPLSQHHVKLACRTCHESTPFNKLKRDCNACHGDWEPASFDHAVTRQVLDENHAETDCAECHTDREFDKPPRCDECHEEDEGIAFPGKRPGPVVIPSRRESDRSSGD